MPKDLHGDELVAGDHVLVPCRVLTVQGGEQWVNVDLETLRPMAPGEVRSNFQLNSGQCVKAGLDRVAPPAAVKGKAFDVVLDEEAHAPTFGAPVAEAKVQTAPHGKGKARK